MKALQYITIILITISLSNTAYGQNKAKKLIGSWGLQYNPSATKMAVDLKQQFNAMSLEKRNNIKKAYKGRTYSFYGDGTYKQIQADGRSTTGSWKFTETDFQMIDKSGRVLRFKILSFTNSRLVIKAKENGESKQFLSQWYLRKLKKN